MKNSEQLLEKIDKNEKKEQQLKNFAEKLEKICIETVENGIMTKDLALMVGPDQKWVNTDEMFNILRKKLEKLNFEDATEVESKTVSLLTL